MKVIKNIIIVILLTVLTICAFGGGCIFWTVFISFFNFSLIVNEIGFYVSTIVGCVLGWVIVPKISEKYL